MLARPNPDVTRIRLRGVPEGDYIAEDGSSVSASVLMNTGVPVPFPRGDFASCVMGFERK